MGQPRSFPVTEWPWLFPITHPPPTAAQSWMPLQYRFTKAAARWGPASATPAAACSLLSAASYQGLQHWSSYTSLPRLMPKPIIPFHFTHIHIFKYGTSYNTAKSFIWCDIDRSKENHATGNVEKQGSEHLCACAIGTDATLELRMSSNCVCTAA